MSGSHTLLRLAAEVAAARVLCGLNISTSILEFLITVLIQQLIVSLLYSVGLCMSY